MLSIHCRPMQKSDDNGMRSYFPMTHSAAEAASLPTYLTSWICTGRVHNHAEALLFVHANVLQRVFLVSYTGCMGHAAA